MNGIGAPCQGAGGKWGLQPGVEAKDGEGFPLPARDPRAGASVSLPPSRAERRLGALLLPAAMGRALLGWGGEMPGLSPWQQLVLGSQRWGLWKGPSPMQMLPREKRPLGPPAHPPGFVTPSLSLQRRNNSPGLAERETIDRRRGITIGAHPPLLLRWAEGPETGARWS